MMPHYQNIPGSLILTLPPPCSVRSSAVQPLPACNITQLENLLNGSHNSEPASLLMHEISHITEKSSKLSASTH